MPRVLLVEDDAGVRDATGMLLRVEGYQVTAVATLAEAVRSAQHDGVPDLLITDYHLRNGELGTQVLAALRAALGAEIGTVLLTGDTAAVAAEAGAQAKVRIAAKPVKAKALLALLRGLLDG